MRPEFEGLQPSDFMNTAARTTWHGRNQLGSVVTNQLPTDNFVFNLWALAQKPEMNWADVHHQNQDDAGVQTLFFVRADDLLLSYRICAVRQYFKSGDYQCRESFATWLMQEENDMKMF